MAELTEIGGSRANVFWPASGTATADVVATLGGLVVDERESLTLVPSTSTRAGADGATVPGRAVAGDADLLVYDADVSRELRDASVTEETSVRGAPLTAAAAYLAFAVAETGGEPVVVSVDRGVERSRVALRTAITAAAQAPGAVPLTLGGVTARIPVPVEIADAATPEARVAAVTALSTEEASLTRFATILDDVTLLTGPERAEILQLLGLGWLPDPVSWQAALDTHRAATTVTLDSVGILPPSPINLFSAGAPIPIWVRNDLPYPANVVLYATPDDLRLDVAQATEATVGPQSNTRVQVPVQARVGNGEVSVQLQLRSRTLEPIGAPQVVDVSVRADWESIGIVVMAVLVGGFLVLGAIRTVLRLRARRAERAAEAHEPPVEAGGATATSDRVGGDGCRDPAVRGGAVSGIGRASVLIGAGTIVSRLTGFLRAVVLVSAVGATTSAGNAFAIANQLPNNIYTIISTGLLTAVIVPQIVKAAQHDDGGRAFVSKLFTLGTVVLVVVTALATVASPVARAAVCARRSRRSSRRSPPRSRTGACRRSSSTASTRSSAKPSTRGASTARSRGRRS